MAAHITKDTSRILDIIAKAVTTDFVTVADIKGLEELGINVTDSMTRLGWGKDRDTILESAAQGKIHMVMFPSVVAAAIRGMVD